MPGAAAFRLRGRSGTKLQARPRGLRLAARAAVLFRIHQRRSAASVVTMATSLKVTELLISVMTMMQRHLALMPVTYSIFLETPDALQQQPPALTCESHSSSFVHA